MAINEAQYANVVSGRLPTLSLDTLRSEIFKSVSGKLKELVKAADIKNAGILLVDEHRYAEISANCNPDFSSRRFLAAQS